MFWKVLGCTVALPIRDQETSPETGISQSSCEKSVTENTHKICDGHTRAFIEVALQLKNVIEAPYSLGNLTT